MPTHVYAHVRTHAYACTHAYICTPYTHTRTHIHTYRMYMYVVIVLATSYLTSIAAYTHASMLITESILNNVDKVMMTMTVMKTHMKGKE